jgi:hypothetical protein
MIGRELDSVSGSGDLHVINLSRPSLRDREDITMGKDSTISFAIKWGAEVIWAYLPTPPLRLSWLLNEAIQSS